MFVPFLNLCCFFCFLHHLAQKPFVFATPWQSHRFPNWTLLTRSSNRTHSLLSLAPSRFSVKCSVVPYSIPNVLFSSSPLSSSLSIAKYFSLTSDLIWYNYCLGALTTQLPMLSLPNSTLFWIVSPTCSLLYHLSPILIQASETIDITDWIGTVRRYSSLLNILFHVWICSSPSCCIFLRVYTYSIWVEDYFMFDITWRSFQRQAHVKCNHH